MNADAMTFLTLPCWGMTIVTAVVAFVTFIRTKDPARYWLEDDLETFMYSRMNAWLLSVCDYLYAHVSSDIGNETKRQLKYRLRNSIHGSSCDRERGDVPQPQQGYQPVYQEGKGIFLRGYSQQEKSLN